MKESAREIDCYHPRAERDAGGGGGVGGGTWGPVGDSRGRRASEPRLLKWLIRARPAQAAMVVNKAARAPPPSPARRPPPRPAPPHAGRPRAPSRQPGLPAPDAGRTPRDNKGAHAAMTLRAAGPEAAPPAPHVVQLRGHSLPPPPPSGLARAPHQHTHPAAAPATPAPPPQATGRSTTAMFLQSRRLCPRTRTMSASAFPRTLPAPRPLAARPLPAESLPGWGAPSTLPAATAETRAAGARSRCSLAALLQLRNIWPGAVEP